MQVGSMIASGRDCFIFAAGAGKVVRRARDGRSLEREASIMRHARRNGFPAPEVFDADGTDILMERVDGPNMVQDACRRPWRLRSHARLLAELLQQLATVRAPGWLPAAEGCTGTSLLHLDLHPLNVLITGDGPRVIDWANASRGAASADMANTWLTMATVPVPSVLPRIGCRLMLRTFLDAIDRDAARPYLGTIARLRCADRYVLPAERASIDRLITRETGALTDASN
jgi:aminoglycoside phosphotransferase (APT) family kinase protein